jgi:hypothetical protein
MTRPNDKHPGSAKAATPAADPGWGFELDGTSIAAVAGGINPQPLPPGHSED